MNGTTDTRCEAPLLSLEHAAQALESLGNPTRLGIFRLLVRAGAGGLPVGGVQQSLGIAPSTLTHHIAHLVQRGLVIQQREGRVLRCLANYQQMAAVIDFLMAECCQGVSGCE
ncbi:MAG: helix-turn-helix domain-containing protein [Pseudomonadales bacterium]